ncbi:unnamed protein product [Hermetia illucens]|uniref:Uncharacterized protein n=1 Tax=Hermetia illucens TaxID=343691 RepID=A0A7R8UEF5_HERIL|nr:uncharacterized protein LOC119659095 [Hermetia illucens]CAD7079273.1 unnamed protein product [Hermetia illucens]
MHLKTLCFALGVLILMFVDSDAMPAVNTQMMQENGMFKIPQWHCLRYFKHDIHMMRRCRMHRGPLVGRRINP